MVPEKALSCFFLVEVENQLKDCEGHYQEEYPTPEKHNYGDFKEGYVLKRDVLVNPFPNECIGEFIKQPLDITNK